MRSIVRIAVGLGVAVSALAWSGPAAGHVVPVPQSIRSGTVVPLSLAVPNERPEPMSAFTATVPAGFRILDARPVDGWMAEVDGDTARWRGGPLAHLSIETFVVRVDVTADPGAATLDLRQLYPSGAQVMWPGDLTVIPGPGAGAGKASESLPALFIIGVVGLSVLVGLGALVWRRRRVRPDPARDAAPRSRAL
jgi:hypothetical protein